MIRPTTNGVLKNYRYHLARNTNTLNHARDTVLTGKRFNSFAEDPAAVARSFQMRTNLLRTDSQFSTSQTVTRKFEVAWNTINQVTDSVNNAKEAILRANNEPTGAGLTALGQQLSQLSEGIVRTMNVKYGDNYVFAGADGLNIPMKLEGSTLTYRGVDVSSQDPKDMEILDHLRQEEHKYADIGLGLSEDSNGQIINTSAFDTSLHATTYLGSGTDEDGDPKNIACLIGRMGELLQNCDADGNFKDDERLEFQRLAKKFDAASSVLSNKHTELDAKASFLKDNQKQLEASTYSLQEQIGELENVDPADAITAFSWAQYCYNSALKVGNSILSQSLMDYLNH